MFKSKQLHVCRNALLLNSQAKFTKKRQFNGVYANKYHDKIQNLLKEFASLEDKVVSIPTFLTQLNTVPTETNKEETKVLITKPLIDLFGEIESQMKKKVDDAQAYKKEQLERKTLQPIVADTEKVEVQKLATLTGEKVLHGFNLIGRDGSGKSTALSLLSGLARAKGYNVLCIPCAPWIESGVNSEAAYYALKQILEGWRQQEAIFVPSEALPASKLIFNHPVTMSSQQDAQTQTSTWKEVFEGCIADPKSMDPLNVYIQFINYVKNLKNTPCLIVFDDHHLLFQQLDIRITYFLVKPFSEIIQKSLTEFMTTCFLVAGKKVNTHQNYTNVFLQELAKSQFMTYVNSALHYEGDIDTLYSNMKNWHTNLFIGDVKPYLANSAKLSEYEKKLEAEYEAKLKDAILDMSTSARVTLFNDMHDHLFKLYDAPVQSPDFVAPVRTRKTSYLYKLLADLDMAYYTSETNGTTHNTVVDRVLMKEFINKMETYKLEDNSARRKDLQKLFVSLQRDRVGSDLKRRAIVGEIVRRCLLAANEFKSSDDKYEIHSHSLNYQENRTFTISADVLEPLRVDNLNNVAQHLKSNFITSIDACYAFIPQESDSVFNLMLYLPKQKQVFLFKQVAFAQFGQVPVQLPSVEKLIPEGMSDIETNIIFLSTLEYVEIGKQIFPVFEGAATTPSQVKFAISFLQDYLKTDILQLRRFFRKIERNMEAVENSLKEEDFDFDYKPGDDVDSLLEKVGTSSSRDALRYKNT